MIGLMKKNPQMVPRPEENTAPAEDNTTTVPLHLHGTGLLLESEHAPFIEYARSFLSDLAADSASAPQIEAVLHWDAQPPQHWQNKSILRRGRRILQDDDALLLTEIADLPGLQVQIRWEGDRMLVDGYYTSPSTVARMALQLGEAQQRLFAISIYYLVYFPLIRYLNHSRGWHVLHAGGVVGPNASWILAGLPGSGKSTFALSLLAQPETRLLSDNLILYDAEKIFAFPEPLHLSQVSLEEAGAEVQRLLGSPERTYSHDRRDYHPPARMRRWEAVPEALFLLSLADRFESRRLAPDLAVDRLLGFDLLAKEITAYEQFAAALDLVTPPGKSSGEDRRWQRRQALRSLLQKLDSFELMLKYRSLEQAVQWVCDRSYKADNTG